MCVCVEARRFAVQGGRWLPQWVVEELPAAEARCWCCRVVLEAQPQWRRPRGVRKRRASDAWRSTGRDVGATDGCVCVYTVGLPRLEEQHGRPWYGGGAFPRAPLAVASGLLRWRCGLPRWRAGRQRMEGPHTGPYDRARRPATPPTGTCTPSDASYRCASVSVCGHAAAHGVGRPPGALRRLRATAGLSAAVGAELPCRCNSAARHALCRRTRYAGPKSVDTSCL